MSRDVAPLTLEQALVLVNGVKEHRLEVLLVTAVVTGMRRGELLALRWTDIDFTHNRLLVMHSVDYIAGHGYVEGEPKTDSGKRLISLPMFLIDLLNEHKRSQEELRENVPLWENRGLVFSNLSGGYLHPNHMGATFRRILKDLGLPSLHFHDLRHSAATILLCMGINIKVIQELLGHSDISITLGVYAHLLPSMQQDVVNLWDSVFKGDKSRGG